jgi:hypothetical protein
MNGLSKKLLTGILFLTAMLIFGGSLTSYAADLQMFSNVRLVNNLAIDGDSFFVEAGEKSFHVRLYFVDCPETSTYPTLHVPFILAMKQKLLLNVSLLNLSLFIQPLQAPWEGQPKAVYMDSSLPLTEMIWRVCLLKTALLVLAVWAGKRPMACHVMK